MIEYPGGRSGYELRRYLHQTQREVALTTADPESDRCQRVIESLKGTIHVPTLRLNTLPQYSPIRRSDWRDASRQSERRIGEYCGSVFNRRVGTWIVPLSDSITR